MGFLALAMAAIAIAVCAQQPKSAIKKSNDIGGLLHDGDILFQSGNSEQCEAIRLATGSEWTHCGIAFKKDGSWVVMEAVQPVKITPLSVFINRGIDRRVEIMRLADPAHQPTAEVTQCMWNQGSRWLDKNYDIYFNWSDEELYCSELVWKVYNACTGIELGTPLPLASFDLTSPQVKAIMHQRYGDSIPLNEKMISPGDVHDSQFLQRVSDGK